MLREVASIVILTQPLELWLQKSLYKQQSKYSIIISKVLQDFKKAHACFFKLIIKNSVSKNTSETFILFIITASVCDEWHCI